MRRIQQRKEDFNKCEYTAMTLRECFEQHDGRPVGKIDHFFDVYEAHFSRYRGTPVRILEIGVHKGGSLELWRTYFGAEAIIHGIDIDPESANVCPEGAYVHIGSQVDDVFIANILEQHGPFDIVIDDGSHIMVHQIATFKMIYPNMADDGLYVARMLSPVIGGNMAVYSEARMHLWNIRKP